MNKISFKAELFTLAVPFMIQNILGNSFSFIDILMISSLGDVNVSALAIVGQLSFILGMILGSISGITVYITQFYFKNDIDNTRKSFVLMMQSSVVVAFLAFIIISIFKIEILHLLSNDTEIIKNATRYLNIVIWIYPVQAVLSIFTGALAAIGKVKLSVAINFISMIINTLLNYLLIYGKFGFPKMEIEGAAVASLISMMFSLIFITGYVYRKKYHFNISFKEYLGFNFNFFRRIYKRITPLLFHEALWASGNVLYTVIFSYMSIEALTSFQLGKTFLNYLMIGVYGFAEASKVMVGRQLVKSEAAAIEYAKKLTKLTIISAFIISAILILTTPIILELFQGVSADSKNQLQKILYIQAGVIIFYFLNNLWIVGVFRPGGDNKFTMIMIFITTWMIGLPLTYVGAFVFKWPAYIVFLLFTMEEVSKAVIGFFRYRSKRWARNLTSELAEVNK